MPEYIDLDRFILFLIEAKRNTYAAGGGSPIHPPALPGSHQLEYCQGDWLYRDVYYGGEFFVGQETVFHVDIPLWSMCYAGGFLTDDLPDRGDIGVFLQSVLRQVTSQSPFRGPTQFTKGTYTYLDENQGEVGRFWGVEVIKSLGQPVYELHYSGGWIK